MTGNILSRRRRRRRLGRAPNECVRVIRRRQYNKGNYTRIVTISTYFLCSGACRCRRRRYTGRFAEHALPRYTRAAQSFKIGFFDIFEIYIFYVGLDL